MELVMRKLITYVAVLLFLAGCFSSKEADDEDLDIQTEKKPIVEKKVSYEDLTKPTKIEIPQDAVTNWQSFFKSPPTSVQKNILEQKLKKWSDNDTSAGLIARGRSESAIGQHGAAEISFRKALRLDSDNHEAMLELAGLYLKKGEISTTFELLARVREVTTTSENISKSFIFKYRYVLALAYLARGERDKGHNILSALIGEVKDFAPAYNALASSYIELDRLNVAEFVMKRAADRIKDNASVFNLLGYIHQRGRQGDAARRWFDKALAVDPNYAPALVNRGNLFAQQFELNQAEKDLLSALAADPSSSDAMVSLGVVQKRQGNIAGARASLSKAVEMNPNNAFARFNLAVLMAKELKQPTDAIRLFNEVIQTTGATKELANMAKTYMADLQRDQISTQ
jgi:tetratricopeptide (TPR) repeat protein